MREMTITNMKKILSKKLEFPDSGGTVIMGANNTGKSTIIQCFKDILQAKNFIPNAVTEGMDAGSIDYTGKDVNDNTIIVHMGVLRDDTSTITAMYYDPVEKKNRKISDPGVIRELLGNYFPLDAHQVFSMLKYAEGRREFFQKYITRIISVEELAKLRNIDTQISEKENKDTKGNMFFTRRDLKASLINKEAILQTLNETQPPKYTREQLKGLNEEITVKLEEQDKLLDKIVECNYKIKEIEDLYKFIEQVDSRVAQFFKDNELEDPGFKSALHWADKLVDSIEKIRPDEAPIKEARQVLIEKSVKVLQFIKSWDDYDELDTRRKELKAEIDAIKNSIEALTEELERLRGERVKIIKNSNMPDGMEIDSDYNLYVDGILFHEASISETLARVYIIKLLLKISGGSFIDIGDWSLYDLKNKELIVKLAKENNCLLMGQYVNNDEEITVKIIE